MQIDRVHRPAAYLDSPTFHPTFLYEALWNFLIVVPVILFLERKGKLAKGARFPVYMILYGMVRFLTELIRTDTTFRLLGISRNGGSRWPQCWSVRACCSSPRSGVPHTIEDPPKMSEWIER